MAIRKRRLLLAGVAAVALAVPALRPQVDAVPPDPYFDGLVAALRARGAQRPVALIDLDRVDANLAQIRAVLGDSAQYRATTKSLPSYDLLRHVLSAMGSNRLMEFHAPYLRPLIEDWVQVAAGAPPGSTQLDILLGKPLPKSEVDAFYASPPPAEKLAATRLRWLVDHESRLADYLAIAQSRHLKLDVAIELDVGLHRGGAYGTCPS
jgi:D-serine deaminase-like pyridoxal phosphate-dependent protein